MTNLLHDISWVVDLRSETLTPIFQVFTALGYPNLIMIGLALAYWLWDKSAATRLMVIVILSTLINAFLKDYWQNPRPDAMFRLDSEVGTSFGMPSGHAQVSAVLWFYLAYELKRLWAWCFASFVVIGICFSRLYLGVHDIEDILMGLLLALVSLVVYIGVLKSDLLKDRVASLELNLLAFILLGLVLRIAWPEAANSIGAIVVVSLPIAWLVGKRLAERLNILSSTEQKMKVPTLIATSFVGLAALIALTWALGYLTPFMNSEMSGLLITTALGLHVTLLGPMLFKLCKLTSS